MPKTGQPDASDAQVMIALYEAQAAQKITEVMGYIWSDDFPMDFKAFRERFDRGSNSTEEQDIHRILAYFETIGTLYRNNLISEDLLFDWLAVDMVWGRVKGFVAGFRRETGSARMYENFEYMARRNASWKPARSRPAAKAKPAAKKTAAAKKPAAKKTVTKKARPAAKRPAARRTPAARKRA
jgi:pyruvate/2-oxoglutarate dehydrogenase complex dihydrolipoamide acyltransferase (E2) component